MDTKDTLAHPPVTKTITPAPALATKWSDLALPPNTAAAKIDHIFAASALNALPTTDRAFVKSRYQTYGLAKLSTTKTLLTVSVRNGAGFEKVSIDYSSLFAGKLLIQGLVYEVDPGLPLQDFYENIFPKAWQKYSRVETNWFDVPLFIFSLTRCVPKSDEAAINSATMPLAWARLCSECVGPAMDPIGTAVGTTIAGGKAVISGIQERSFKACGRTFCEEAPIIGAVTNLSRLRKARATGESGKTPLHTK